MVFLEQKWLWAKLPIKLPLRVPHRSPGLNHTRQVIAQHSPPCPFLAEADLSGVLILDCCNGYSLSPSHWRYCSHLHRPDPALSHKLSLCSAPVLAFSPGYVSQAQYMPSTVCNSAYFFFLFLFPYTRVGPHFISTCPIHRFISPATPT